LEDGGKEKQERDWCRIKEKEKDGGALELSWLAFAASWVCLYFALAFHFRLLVYYCGDQD
jgi:hypothetical protein